ncbi:hypothetical protein [Corynebacterium diphtheriae]|uniref:Uncharacterized protein n=1 Tax=Corynebacterium diphtheriae (strain ATCC 700971 / NCTC 13129 / Biotype gravis) TaxID=257309 RepID=Q6NIH4_CORDI|nr:hypothetical protein [Corynebacterium diphtheriae]KKA80734.1 hypothetical protein VN94_09630 [Corynebacterium diphtheriae]CAB0502051.1 hypothetical protein CIP107504_00873 [Corynebacterium diphtheriae]CAB0641927.1 hypothetical protein CIP107560_00873 [Corynebacterium diphtheriae]CAB0641957.1 hypothetical protein CIP107576_00871 [Corynebacterium diphtheriae]CAB0684543.1 hypothetical protein FRC0037_00653 [Corynebacterium diphtheriae]
MACKRLVPGGEIERTRRVLDLFADSGSRVIRPQQPVDVLGSEGPAKVLGQVQNNVAVQYDHMVRGIGHDTGLESDQVCRLTERGICVRELLTLVFGDKALGAEHGDIRRGHTQDAGVL